MLSASFPRSKTNTTRDRQYSHAPWRQHGGGASKCRCRLTHFFLYFVHFAFTEPLSSVKIHRHNYALYNIGLTKFVKCELNAFMALLIRPHAKHAVKFILDRKTKRKISLVSLVNFQTGIPPPTFCVRSWLTPRRLTVIQRRPTQTSPPPTLQTSPTPMSMTSPTGMSAPRHRLLVHSANMLAEWVLTTQLGGFPLGGCPLGEGIAPT